MTAYRSPLTGTKFEDIRRDAHKEKHVPRDNSGRGRTLWIRPDLRRPADRSEHAIKPN